MAAHSVVMMVTAQAGSGKSYRRCAVFLLEEWLKEPDRPGCHWSNFPIKWGALEEAAEKRYGIGPERLRELVRVIPPEEMERWRLETSGPWEFFAGVDLTHAHIAIDEIHNFCGRKASKGHRAKWQAWLGELRHMGATIEFLSQHQRKVAQEIHDEAGTQLQLVNSEMRRDPVFGILLGDWYELRAGLITRQYSACIWELEKRDVDGKKVVEDKRIFALDPYYFGFYDSYSKPQAGGKAASSGRVYEFQKRSRLGLIWWFFCRNAFRLISRGAVGGFLIYLISGGGGTLMNQWLRIASMGAVQPAKAAPAKPVPVGGVAAGAPRAVPVGGKAVVASQPVGEMVPLAVLQDAQSVVQRLQVEVAELRERELRASAIVAISADAVTFRSGYTYRVGEMIDFGPYEGRRIEKIWWGRRAALLSDGRWLRMQRVEERGVRGAAVTSRYAGD